MPEPAKHEIHAGDVRWACARPTAPVDRLEKYLAERGYVVEKRKEYDPDEAISIPHPQLLRLMGEKVLRAAGEPAERDA